MLTPAAWSTDLFQEHGEDQTDRKDVIDGTADIQIASFESVLHHLGPQSIDDTEAIELDPPPKAQSIDHTEGLTSSFTHGNSSLTESLCLPTIRGPDVVLPEQGLEHEDDLRDVQDVPEMSEAEEVGELHPGDIVFSQYVISEVISEHSQARTGTVSPPVLLEDSTQRCGSDGAIPSISAPTVSVESNTPPLSPAATVTNSSSAPDPSIVTSDLSTVNQPSISVVTTTSSPPPIHVPRIPAAHTDIRQPLTNAGYTSDGDQNSGGEESVLPDPRLPPEPTHLGIPIGVVGRSLREDKEERAESMKVEPPRSESEGGSLVGEGRNVRDTEGTPPAPAICKDVQEDTIKQKSPKVIPGDNTALSNHVDQMVARSNIPGGKAEQDQKEDASDELVSPDSASDHPRAEGERKRVSQPPSDALTNAPSAEFHLPQSLSSTLKLANPPLPDIASNVSESGTTETTENIEVLPKIPLVDISVHELNGNHTDLNGCGYPCQVVE